MSNIGERVKYCDKCGWINTVSDEFVIGIRKKYMPDFDYIENMNKGCRCGGKYHFLDNDDILSYKQFELYRNKAFLEMNGYKNAYEYKKEMEQKVIKEFISKLPTFDEYAMYERLDWERQSIEAQQKRQQEQLQSEREEEAKKIHCPNCNSTNVKPISGTKRIGSILTFGILSNNIGKSYECKNCKYKW